MTDECAINHKARGRDQLSQALKVLDGGASGMRRSSTMLEGIRWGYQTAWWHPHGSDGKEDVECDDEA